MAETLKVGIIGGGWPGRAHASGYRAASGFKIVAVADLIPQRRAQLIAECGPLREFGDAKELIADKSIDVVSVCLPTYLHAPVASAALRSGKHVVCEKPPAMNAKEARKLARAASNSGKVLMYSVQRRFGGAEQAAHQAIGKGYAGNVFHARASWTRTRGIPIGTGWFTDKSKSGGGALIDVGFHVLDLAWYLLGQPKPLTAFGATHQRFKDLAPKQASYDVEDSAFAIVRFEGGKTLELASSWALNQPPQQQGTLCRLYGDKGAVDVYTPQGALIYRSFSDKGESTPTLLKPPKGMGHPAMMRHFRECILGKTKPLMGADQGVVLMQIVDAIYRSAESGKSVEIK
jgi:predicted dehydrogenase